MQMEPLSILDMDSWDRLASYREVTYTIPSDMRSRPLPNDGRKRAKPLKKGSQKTKAISQSKPTSPKLTTKQIASTSGGYTQDAANSGPQSEPPSLLLTVQSSFSATTSTPSPPSRAPADMCRFFSDRLPPSPHLDLPLSTSFDEDTPGAVRRNIGVQPPSSESNCEASRALCSSQHNILVRWSSASSPTSSLSLFPKSLPPISDLPAQRPHAPPSSLLLARDASPVPSNYSYLEHPPSPKVFCDLTHEQLRLAIKHHDAAVDARLASQPAIIADKNKVVFHPDTNDNGTYATGSDPFRKRKKRRRPTPFFPESSYSTGDETNSDEGDEDEEPEPQIEVDYEELVEQAQLARLRGRRRISRSAILPSMVPAKSMEPNLEAKSHGVARRSSSTLPSLTLSAISEEDSPRDASGTPPYTVVFVGANGGPDEVWQLPASAFMFVKSLATRQPQAKKLRVEQVPCLQGAPLRSSSVPVLNQPTYSRTSKKRKIDCVEGVEYLQQTSKRTRHDRFSPSSCIIC
ncbi:hypothetical protein AZE42_00145 [Rhizopogon vesiculosus]|uniref:Uncharacterized protein n=1 Tax=Rhizopogon vesiculosus TaxID=180088 RepID=A0A1J8Q6I2_9AGAM|nr:hypothetical protein AZE42_00145 [Rhizopogon vesiculosus]